MSDDFERLRSRLATVRDLEAAQSVLSWDQETYMPEGGAEARARQISTLSQLAHETFTDAQTGELLNRLRAGAEEEPYDSFKASLLRVTKRNYEQATRIPSELVAKLAQTTSRAKQAWKKARTTDDFSVFEPHLEQIVQLTIEKAEALGYEEVRYDALLDQYEPGMTTKQVQRIFAPLREDLVPVVERLASHANTNGSPLHRTYDEQGQWDFGMAVLEDIGYDLTRGRQDRSAHPFTTMFSIDDVRITTRFKEDDLSTGFFSTLHEAGHALYEQGIDPSLEGTPLAEGASLGIHESQSRLWENMIGRSRPFWEHYLPALKHRFGEELAEISLDAFYRASNVVTPSLIRVESDEVTYNLHIMVRFEIEQALINEEITAAEVPEVWRQTMSDYLGIVPENHAEGALQDIHWSLGALGYFPTYALGNLMAAQLFEKIQEDLPDLEQQVSSGRFEELLDWLRSHIHQHGRKFTGGELLERVTGAKLSAEPWLRYVREKYGKLYGVEL